MCKIRQAIELLKKSGADMNNNNLLISEAAASDIENIIKGQESMAKRVDNLEKDMAEVKGIVGGLADKQTLMDEKLDKIMDALIAQVGTTDAERQQIVGSLAMKIAKNKWVWIAGLAIVALIGFGIAGLFDRADQIKEIAAAVK
jgi:hypothetical protein